MHAPLFLRLAMLSAFFLSVVGCGPPQYPVSVKVKQVLNGPSDLLDGIAANPRWHAYQLKNFQLNHVWSGGGFTAGPGEPYRAKISLWEFADDTPKLAEIYFHDLGHEMPNPSPETGKRPYQLHFPIGTIGPILQALRNANEPVYLYYYLDQWAVGIAEPEPVGVD